MPRAASRITLEVTGVSVERLQEISEEDAQAEGAEYGYGFGANISHRRMFKLLWDGLNAARGHGWDTNPWVWVVEFRRIGQ